MSSLTFHDIDTDGNACGSSSNLYDVLVGGFWNYAYPSVPWLEFELRMMLGGGICPGGGPVRGRGGLSVLAGGSVNIITSNNFKLRGIAEWQTTAWDKKNVSWLNVPLVGFSANFFW